MHRIRNQPANVHNYIHEVTDRSFLDLALSGKFVGLATFVGNLLGYIVNLCIPRLQAV